MASITSLSKLILSLSKSEKRYFRIYSNLQDGEKDYQNLFDLFEKSKFPIDLIKEEFKKKYPKSNYEITANHLYKVLIRCLTNYDPIKDIESKLINGIKEIKLLFEKELNEEALSLIDSLNELAIQYEKFDYIVILLRLKLAYNNKSLYEGLNENAIVEHHSVLRKTLNQLLVNGEHSALYDLLYIRYLKDGPVRNAKEKEKLNDLLVNESNLASNPRYKSFEGQKTHQMFQSLYFLMIGDKDSSLRSFSELDLLFDENKLLWNNQPGLYFQYINGVLTSLRQNGFYKEMEFFISKLNQLEYTNERDSFHIQKCRFIFESQIKIDQEEYADALILIKKNIELIDLSNSNMNPFDKAELCFQHAIILFWNKDFKSAASALRILKTDSTIRIYEIYRAMRILNMFCYLEMKEFLYLDSEIRSFKRDLLKRNKMFEFEKIILSYLTKMNHGYSLKEMRQETQKTITEIQNIMNNTYEKQFISWFNVIKWLEKKCINSELQV